MPFSNVILVGPMGVGKSTIGRLTADLLGLTFLDTDREIEERCGADIAWIFDVEGEEGFRVREQQMLEELVQREGVLLATGGGIVMRPENRRLMISGGSVVFLTASQEQLLERTARDKRRPLLQTDNPAEVMRKLLELRDPLYREVADFVVTTEYKNPRAVAQEICRLLEEG